MVAFLGPLVAQDVGDVPLDHGGDELVAMCLARVERRQALQDPQREVLFEVLAVLLREAGAADQLFDLAPNDATGETVDLLGSKSSCNTLNLLPGRGGEGVGHDDWRRECRPTKKRRRCESRHDRRRPQSPPLCGRQNVR